MKRRKKKNKENIRFSIITPTIRKECIDNIMANYYRQIYQYKELIIVINSDDMNVQDFDKYVKKDSSIHVYKILSETTTGNSINFAIKQANYEYISRFDDDDYYGSHYLEEVVDTFNTQKCDMVAKFCLYTYLNDLETLILRYTEGENKYVEHCGGGRLCFKKGVFNDAQFANTQSVSEINFNRQAKEKGYLMYSTSRFNYMSVREKYQIGHRRAITSQMFLEKEETIIVGKMTYEEACSFVENGKKNSDE